jgi:hypothetical protein
MGFFSTRNFVIFFTILTFTFTPAHYTNSAPIHDFNEVVADAYGFYREAFFLLRTGNPQVASLELEKMSVSWKSIIKRFKTTPPEIYSDDPLWKNTLETVNKAIVHGLAGTIEGNPKRAIKILGPIRKMLSELRKRNGVFVYSDTVDKANAAFMKLKIFRHNPPDFNVVEEVDQLRQSLATTVYWYKQCVETAPATLRQNPEFRRLMDDSLYSLSRIWVAIANKKKLNLINILRGLSSSDQMLFLRFG